MDGLKNRVRTIGPTVGTLGPWGLAAVAGSRPLLVIAALAIGVIAQLVGQPELFVRWAVAFGRKPTKAQQRYLLDRNRGRHACRGCSSPH